MTWNAHALALEVAESFAASQVLYTGNTAYDIVMTRVATQYARKCEREKLRLREKRKAKRSACRFVQLRLPFPERKIMHEKMPADRNGTTQKFVILSKKLVGDGIDEVDVYLTVDTYPDGRLGAVALSIGKIGDTEAVYDEWAKIVSLGLQWGIPIDAIFRMHVGTRFGIHGATTNKRFPRCTSILDLVSRWILYRFGSPEAKAWIASQIQEEVQP